MYLRISLAGQLLRQFPLISAETFRDRVRTLQIARANISESPVIPFVMEKRRVCVREKGRVKKEGVKLRCCVAERAVGNVGKQTSEERTRGES